MYVSLRRLPDICVSPYLQAYHGLRKIAKYPSLSDTGGNTDVVTRKVWATFLAMLDPSIRPMNKGVTEGLMLTDGDDPERSTVEEIPFERQAAARLDIATTATGEPYTTPPPNQTRANPTRSPTSIPSDPVRHRGTRKRSRPTVDDGPSAPRSKTRRTRRPSRPETVAARRHEGEPAHDQATDDVGAIALRQAASGGYNDDAPINEDTELLEEESSDSGDADAGVDFLLAELRAGGDEV